MSSESKPQRRRPLTLGGQLRRNVRWYVVGGVALVGVEGLMLARDFLFRDGVDAALSHDAGRTHRIVSLALAVIVAGAAVQILATVATLRAALATDMTLRGSLLSRLHRLGVMFFQRMPTGEIMSRCTHDVAAVRDLVGVGVVAGMGTLFGLASAITVMLSMSPWLTLAALVPFPLLALVTQAFGKAVYPYAQAKQEAVAALSDRAFGTLSGVRVVRTFCLEETSERAFARASEECRQRSLRLARLECATEPIVAVIGTLGTLIVCWFGSHLIHGGDLTHGSFLAFWAALGRLLMPLAMVTFLITLLQKGRASYARLDEILSAEPDMTDGPLTATQPVEGSLEVKDLSFAFGDGPVLRNVSFTLRAGQSLAIVGPMGSGKSTLALLLARLLPTPRGAVFLDGQDVCDLPLDAVRSAVGFAQQEPFLFSTTIARNIAMGLEDVDGQDAKERIRAAADKAHILHEAHSLPNGLHSVVGERGVQLSGGQKQRVALARALAYEPPILILDDPMSAVDARTEKDILRTIEQEAARRTLILVTSRVVAASKCDHIVVLGGGRVVEQGSHAQLKRLNGLYSLFREEQRLKSEISSLRPPRGETQ